MPPWYFTLLAEPFLDRICPHPSAPVSPSDSGIDAFDMRDSRAVWQIFDSRRHGIPIGKGLCMQPHVFQWPTVAIAAVKVNIALLAGVTS
jgi:hypothetical protein